MTLYIFDFSGTLTTLRDPVGFIGRLRKSDPGCKVVLWSGSLRGTIHRRCPGLPDAVDARWFKPGLRKPAEGSGWEPTKIIVVDDDNEIRRMAKAALRRLAPVTLLTPDALEGLVVARAE